jgi:hypothetical protein
VGLVALAIVAVVAGGSAAAGSSAAGPTGSGPQPEFFYTANYPPALKEAPYNLCGGTLSVGAAHVIARLPAADGVAFAPDGNLVVGGGKTGMVFEVDPNTGAVTAKPSGIPAAYHVTVSRDGTTAWTAGIPGAVAKVPLKPFGPGTPVPVRGDDQAVTTVGFTPSGVFYTSSDSHGSGNFGTFDLTSFTTHRAIVGLRGAHGFSWDPFSNDVILFGSYVIAQIDPSQPGTIVSQKLVTGVAFDQGIADGRGRVLVASNTGYVILLDYSGTGKVADGTVKKAFLDTNLDDLATLNPPATTACTKSSSGTSGTKKLALVIAVLIVAGVAVVILRPRRAQPTGYE